VSSATVCAGEALVLRAAVEDFYYHEAELLDDGRLRAWLELCAPAVDYRIPVRETRMRIGGGDVFSATAYHLVCDRGSLETRVSRFDTAFAWAEETMSRTRRIVGNVRIQDANANQISVRSNFHLSRARDDYPTTLLSGERWDVLERAESGLRLAVRNIRLDHTILPVENLAIMF
jgi:ethylbenzene dioxygenase beta subunit